MSRILLAGAHGMLGTDLVTALQGRDLVALGRAELDVTDADAVLAAAEGADVVIDAAAYTKVDDAETHEEEARAVNAAGAGNLAAAAARHGARFVLYSTDYVFDGTATEPYPEDAPRNPVSAYGRTKAEGEELALNANPRTYLLRTAWLYGAAGASFPRTMLRLAAERDTVSVVTDQVGQPTWTGDLAAQTVALLDSGAAPGIYHATNSGSATWFELAKAVFEEAGLDPARVLPTDSTTFVRPAPRPAYSVLGHGSWQRAGLPPMRPWSEALHDAIATGAFTT